jgi:hypothetical protein
MNGLNFDSAAREFGERVDNAISSGALDSITDSDLERVMTAAIRLYFAKSEASGSLPPPIDGRSVTPTEIVVVVSEMIKAGGLNLFDLSMWFRR